MHAVVETLSADDTEEKAFLLFREECTEEFKRLVIFLVYTVVKQNQGISQNKLAFMLEKEYNIGSTSVSAAIGALTSGEIFNALSAYKMPKEKSSNQTMLLRTTNRSQTIDSWLDMLRSKDHPALKFQVKV